MSVLINGLFLKGSYGGIHHTTEHLFNSLTSFTPGIDLLVHQGYQKKGGNYFTIRNALLNNRLGRILFENFKVSTIIKKGGYRLYHSMNYVLPLYCRKFKTVLTIHDTISLDYPHFCKNSSILYHGLLMGRSIKQASKVVAVSHKVKDDILRRFRIHDNKVEVVYHGIDPIFRHKQSAHHLARIREKYNLQIPYLLFVGTIEPKKNLEGLIDAFIKTKTKLELPHSLVIAGKSGWKNKNLLARINELERKALVKKLDYVAQQDLPAIYQLSDALAFPSFYEGFGLPPLEAMASGIPTLISNKGASVEITGGNSVVVDPHSHHDIVQGLNKLLTDQTLRARLIKTGLKHVEQFTWENAARKMSAIYQNTR